MFPCLRPFSAKSLRGEREVHDTRRKEEEQESKKARKRKEKRRKKRKKKAKLELFNIIFMFLEASKVSA